MEAFIYPQKSTLDFILPRRAELNEDPIDRYPYLIPAYGSQKVQKIYSSFLLNIHVRRRIC
ncbi:hypothetical protein DRO64_09475 [Candidatus Bathyarchaeota archaeon]|nr:MAG: hypothetical protein DRO64_09475 [Candidatus Bathyarchaeota archaeon]